MPPYTTFAEAKESTRVTLRLHDKAKWQAYSALRYPQSMQWRKDNGHAEFVRLQRLSFYGFI